MNRIKCRNCGLVNSGSDENCRRCAVNLHSLENAPPKAADATPPVSQFTPSAINFSSSGSSYLFEKVVAVLAILIGGCVYISSSLSISNAEGEREQQRKKSQISEKLERDRRATEDMKKMVDSGPCKMSDPAGFGQCMKNTQDMERMDRIRR